MGGQKEGCQSKPVYLASNSGRVSLHRLYEYSYIIPCLVVAYPNTRIQKSYRI